MRKNSRAFRFAALLLALVMAVCCAFAEGAEEETAAVGVSVTVDVDETAEKTVDEDVTVKAAGEQDAYAVEITAHGDSSATVTVNADLTASSDNGDAVGVRVMTVGEEEAGEPEVEFTVNGDISARMEDGTAWSGSMPVDAGVCVVNQGGSVTGTVNGSIETTGDGIKVEIPSDSGAERLPGEIALTVDGDIACDNDVENACGINVFMDKEGSSLALTVTGDVDVDSKWYANGMYLDVLTGSEAEVTVKGDISAVAAEEFGSASGFDVVTGEKSNVSVTVGGDVTAESQTCSDGIRVDTMYDGGTVSVTVLGDISTTVEQESFSNNGVEEEAYSTAVYVFNPMGDVTVNVGGDISAEGGNSSGISISSRRDEMQELTLDGTTEVTVGGDVTADRYGLYVDLMDDATADIVIDGTLEGRESAVVLVDEAQIGENVTLTVWEIKPNGEGDLVSRGKMDEETEEWNLTRDADEEKSIQYIVRIGDSSKEYITTDARTSGEYSVAKQNETVTLKLTVPAGYQVTGAYGDVLQQLQLLKDADGNYFIIMPRGGGVELSVKLEKIPEESKEEEKKDEPVKEEQVAPGRAGQAVAVAVTTDGKALSDAEAKEAEAVRNISDITGENEDGDAVILMIGKEEKSATDVMKVDYANLSDALVDAAKALGTIPADIAADAEDGVELSAGDPFRAVASAYPVTITFIPDDPESFVGMMTFVNGKWVKLNTVVNDDGSVTFILDSPSILSIVTSIPTVV